MKLGYLLNSLGCSGFDPDIEIECIYSDSRRVTRGSAFVCIHGGQAGLAYLGQAREMGASVMICERELAKEFDGAIGCDTPRRVLAFMHARLCGDDWRRMKFIGVTGTNGKTTTAFMLYTVLAKMGKRCSFIGTTGCLCMGAECAPKDIYASDRFSTMTTPDPEFLYPVLMYMAECNIEYVVMEVSSHSIKQHKIDPIDFEVGIFTNLSPEHLDFHADMNDYYRTKLSFINRCKEAIFNADDSYCAAAFGESECEKRILCSATLEADCFAANISTNCGGGMSYALCKDGFSICASTLMPGMPGVYDSMLALACASELTGKFDELSNYAINLCPAEGRMQLISPPSADISVYIDYAHTPAALSAMLESISQLRMNGQRIVLLFGCGGDRDRSKRAEMGRIASEYADMTYITSDNSRSESTASIIRDIMQGFDKSKPHKILRERRAAIEDAINSALPGDIVILAGKGHEKYEINSKGRYAFDEKGIALRALQKRRGIY